MCCRASVRFLVAFLAACQGTGALADINVRIGQNGSVVDQRSNMHEGPSGHIAETCHTIETEARRSGLPPGFLARLIWKESRFNPNAVSAKGARGIAQFMPATARERGLADPFDPELALAASAAYLADLKDQFGNLGLAAAAYNAGPSRVARWRNNASRLPWETRNFVRSITGLTATQWADPDVDAPEFVLHKTRSFSQACLELARFARTSRRRSIIEGTAAKPWGALIASHFTKTGADASLRRLANSYRVVAEHQPIEFLRRRNPSRGGKVMFQVLLGADDRDAARSLCSQLNRTGGACIVVRN